MNKLLISSLFNIIYFISQIGNQLLSLNMKLNKYSIYHKINNDKEKKRKGKKQFIHLRIMYNYTNSKILNLIR